MKPVQVTQVQRLVPAVCSQKSRLPRWPRAQVLIWLLLPGEEKDAISRTGGRRSWYAVCFQKTGCRFRKRWLAFGARIAGKIVVDDGCAKAVRKAGGCSILPAGITAVEGGEAGNTISVGNKAGRELARGLSNYSSEELDVIKGSQDF